MFEEPRFVRYVSQYLASYFFFSKQNQKNLDYKSNRVNMITKTEILCSTSGDTVLHTKKNNVERSYRASK